MEIYEPQEDTYLILDEIKKLANGNVLDMGTGSGILALAAAVNADHVLGLDINPDAVKFAKDTAKVSGLINLEFHHSNLFSYLEDKKQRFDLITFNPPYLPEDIREPKESRLITTGGKKGYELIEKFFEKASKYLMPFGKILIIFSSLTGKEHVHNIMEKYAFNFQKISEQELFAETLYVYLAEKSDLLRHVESNEITNIKKLTKGHRGLIFTGKLKNKKIVVKQQRSDTEAMGRIENEARWLKVLNKKGIGPDFLFFEKDYFVYEYVDGTFIPEFLEKAEKKEIKNVLKEIFNQCYILDNMSINKEEMHNPFKHIIINENKVTMLDFERTHFTQSPKNVTQFTQYVSNNKNKKLLESKKFKINKQKIQTAAKNYKKQMNKTNLNKIVRLI